MKTAVVGVIRVSTEEQASDGVSLRAQREKIEGYCKLYDLDLICIYEDAGFSGKTLDRPGLQQALTMLKTGKADGLVIAKLDRLSRSVADWNILIDKYFSEKAGKNLFSVADSIDTRSAAGRLVLNILMSVGQWEREAIAERTATALQNKIANAERVGSVRFGYDLNDDQTTLHTVTDEQEAIQVMRQLRTEGVSYDKIAKTLVARGIGTKKGGKWGAQTVYQILNRKTVAKV